MAGPRVRSSMLWARVRWWGSSSQPRARLRRVRAAGASPWRRGICRGRVCGRTGCDVRHPDRRGRGHDSARRPRGAPGTSSPRSAPRSFLRVCLCHCRGRHDGGGRADSVRHSQSPPRAPLTLPARAAPVGVPAHTARRGSFRDRADRYDGAVVQNVRMGAFALGGLFVTNAARTGSGLGWFELGSVVVSGAWALGQQRHGSRPSGSRTARATPCGRVRRSDSVTWSGRSTSTSPRCSWRRSSVCSAACCSRPRIASSLLVTFAWMTTSISFRSWTTHQGITGRPS